MAKHAQPGDSLVIFRIDDQFFGLPLAQVSRVERAVKITAIPDSPRGLLGVISNHGNVVPVLNMRYKTGLHERDIDVNDQFILVSCHYFTIVIPADKVEGVSKAHNIVTPQRLIGKDLNIPELMDTDNGIVMVITAEQLMSFNETLAIQDVIDSLPSSAIDADQSEEPAPADE